MRIRKPQLLCTRLFLVLLLGFSQAAGAATQFPGRERAWNKIPTIVVLGQGDWRNHLVIDGVDFWNQQLAEIGSGFRLGPVTFVSQLMCGQPASCRPEIGFAEGRVIACGTSPVEVFHAAQASGKHPFVTRVGHENEPNRMRRASFAYDLTYPNEPLPVMRVEFRRQLSTPGLVLEKVIPDTGAVRPICLAVLRLITNSNLVDCSIGRSASL